MNHIIITKQEAEEIKGDYGMVRSDGSYPARIEPMASPDGTYVFPETCLSGFGLESIKTKLESMITPNNVQEIKKLPKLGDLCEAGELYKYDEINENGYHGLVKCVQTHNRTIYPPEQTPALFSFFRENSDTLEWIMNEWVELGWKRVYGGKTYEVIQAHQTLETWTPDVTPALWKDVSPVVDIPVWVQPTGSHDAYQTGDKVHFPTITDPVYESLIDANVYSPTVYPQGWRLVP